MIASGIANKPALGLSLPQLGNAANFPLTPRNAPYSRLQLWLFARSCVSWLARMERILCAVISERTRPAPPARSRRLRRCQV